MRAILFEGEQTYLKLLDEFPEEKSYWAYLDYDLIHYYNGNVSIIHEGDYILVSDNKTIFPCKFEFIATFYPGLLIKEIDFISEQIFNQYKSKIIYYENTEFRIVGYKEHYGEPMFVCQILDRPDWGWRIEDASNEDRISTELIDGSQPIQLFYISAKTVTNQIPLK